MGKASISGSSAVIVLKGREMDFSFSVNRQRHNTVCVSLYSIIPEILYI